MKIWCTLVISFTYLCVVSAEIRFIPCITPNREKACCRTLFSCPILRDAVDIRDPSVEQFIQESAALCGKSLNVCCGTRANYTNLKTIIKPNMQLANRVQIPKMPVPIIVPAQITHSKREAAKKLLPSKTYCGMQHADDYFRDYNTAETTVDELPWVMFVSCEDSDGNRASSISSNSDFAVTSRDCDCSGVLINNRYVLNSSNCASAKWVGLGQREQYRNVSCTKTQYDDDCSEALTKTPFTEQIRHPNNMLMLLRLKSIITYTDYIRPICLPLEVNDRIDIGDMVTSPKWTIDEKVRGFVRTKLNHTITTNDKCSSNFKELKLVNSPRYMCTALEDMTTVLCKTDSGAPMMYKRNNNWFVGGILYAGYCLEKTAVGNRISSEVVDWILDNIRA